MTCTMCTQGILGSSFTRSLNGVPIALSSEPVLQYPLLWLYGYFSLACIHVGYLLQSNQIRAFFWIYDFLAWRTASAAAYHCTFNPRFPNLISLPHYIYDHSLRFLLVEHTTAAFYVSAAQFNQPLLPILSCLTKHHEDNSCGSIQLHFACLLQGRLLYVPSLVGETAISCFLYPETDGLGLLVHTSVSLPHSWFTPATHYPAYTHAHPVPIPLARQAPTHHVPIPHSPHLIGDYGQHSTLG